MAALSHSPATSPGDHAPGDEVSEAQRFGDVPVQSRRCNQSCSRFEGQPRALHEQALRRAAKPGTSRAAELERFDVSRALDEPPLARRTADARTSVRSVAEERAFDGVEVGRAPHHDQHGDAERRVERVDVDHVEARDGDALQEDGPDVSAELALIDEVDHAPGRIDAVPAYAAAHDAVEPRPGADGADEQHAAPVSSLERPVVETDDVHGGECILARSEVSGQSIFM